MKEVILKTAGMFDEYEQQDKDYELWKSISEYMDGEVALVMESAAKDGKYVFLGLTDREKDKELFYMIEQDSMIGRYIGARELFEAFQSTSSSRSQTKMKTFGLLLIKISIH